MTFRLLSILAFAFAIYSCSGACEEENSRLKNQIAEYEQQEELTALAMNDYDKQIQEYKTKDDSLRMFRDSIDILANKMRSSGRASKADNKAMNSYVNEMRRILAENKTLTANLTQYVDSADIGDNPALVVKVLAQNLETKEREILDLQNQIANLQKEVKGLKMEIVTVASQRDSIADVNVSLAKDKEDLSEAAKILKVSKITNSIFNKKGKDITNSKITLLGSIEKLKITFTIEANKFAETGTHAIYICIINSQQVLTNSSSNLFSDANGKQIGYTMKSSVNYSGQLIRTYSEWNVGNNKLEKGNYEVLIYDSKGNKIGSSLFTL